MIPLSDLAKYYAKNTDGGAHPAWLKYAGQNDQISDDQVAIKDIALGMIAFSSNANTEWLTQKLKIDHVNARLEKLGLKDHSPIYYLVSSLFVGKELYPGEVGGPLVKKLKALSQQEYESATYDIHEKLAVDTAYINDLGDLSMGVQKVWSDRLVKSTVRTYAELIKKINSRKYFSPEVHHYLDETLEIRMKNPANQSWLQHSGFKGGSTAFVLTSASYATDKEGAATEIVYFFNDLNFMQNTRIQGAMNDFELGILSDASFRKELEELFLKQ